MTTDTRLEATIAAIDAANARDPNLVEVDGRPEPAELVYGRRMTLALTRMAPAASEHLRIAARGQHIERWTSPRKSFPDGRAGYLAWRRQLKDYHARRLGEIMNTAGYPEEDATRVGALVRKERLKTDPEAQMLEDVVCVVFLEHYLTDFMRQRDDEKLGSILAKTWEKMSPAGHEQAMRLTLPQRVVMLLKEELARETAKPA
jgi:hypothetical protein